LLALEAATAGCSPDLGPLVGHSLPIRQTLVHQHLQPLHEPLLPPGLVLGHQIRQGGVVDAPQPQQPRAARCVRRPFIPVTRLPHPATEGLQPEGDPPWGVGSVAPGSALPRVHPLVEGAQIQPPQPIPEGAHRVILRHQPIGVDGPPDDLLAVEGLGRSLPSGGGSVGGVTAAGSSRPFTGTACSALMRPPFPSSDPGPTPNRPGALVLNHPLDLLALLQLQSFGQRGGTDQIELAVATGPLDQLHF